MTVLDRRVRVQFGHAVRARRLALKLTQEALAWAVDLDRPAISMIERGIRFPELAFQRFGPALDWTRDELIAATGLAEWELIEANVALALPEPDPDVLVPCCAGPFLLRSQVHPGWYHPVTDEAR